MSWRTEKNSSGAKDLVWSGVEKGVSPSPHKGNGNMQAVNIATESGEVMCSFSRIQQTITPFTGQTLTFSSGNTVTSSQNNLVVGQALTIGTGIGGLSAGNYYVLTVNGLNLNQITLTATYGGAVVTGMSAGSATLTSFNLQKPVGKAVEAYFDGTAQQYRYYIVTNKGDVWVNDTGTTWSSTTWTPIDIASSLPTGAFNWGIGVYQGYVHILSLNSVYVKETSLLGVAWKQTNLHLNSQNLIQPHFVLTGHQAAMNYTDANFVGQIQGDSTTTANLINSWTYGAFTVSGNILTVDHLVGGNFPLVGQKITFTAGTSVDTAVAVDVVYYVIAANYSVTETTFEISATVGGSTISWNHNAVGTQYFNSYDPGITTGAVATDTNGVSTLTFTPQACTLPPNEVAISLGEAGNVLLVGCNGNVLYPWDQTSPTASGIINLPENGATSMLSVNNMVYVFAGNKGNVYITNGSTASLVITVPDYCAGIAGTPSSYIEPYFTWGGSDYIRGRVYFSILDQTATKSGNCGGVWSFVPTQNFFVGQDTGLSLRMENVNSYGTYNGYAPVIIANQSQASIGVQYFSAWVSAYNYPSSGVAGVDASGTYPINTSVVETDIVPTGTMLEKTTFGRIEYKLASPLLSGESVSIKYRLNLTDAWQSFTTALVTDTTLSGYYPASFQLSQWLQLQASLIPNGTATFSGNRLTELRVVNS